MSVECDALLAAVKEYCSLIESSEANDEWLKKVSSLLPRLHAEMATFVDGVELQGSPLNIDLDARFELFSRLHMLLGERDAYWMAFDVTSDGQQMSGSLADDLTDIYCELKQGLFLLDQEDSPNMALSGWCEGYKVHWGQHLLDAERHLYDLSVRGQLAV